MTDQTRPASDDAAPDSDRLDTTAPTLADDDHDPDRDEQGRIGYGRLGKWSPIGLALLIVATVGVIYLVDRNNDDSGNTSAPMTTGELQDPRPAPDFELALLNDDGTISLDDLAGKTVVLNFWASWCGPCREEMPALQESWEAHRDDDVVFVGVGAKNDKQGEAEAFVEEFGITYPIGRDTEGGDSLAGAIEKDYGIFGYPATFFISPDGMINQIVFAPIETDQLETYIANASD